MTMNLDKIRTVGKYGAAKVVPGLILFGAVPLWTRLFGSAEYGLYSIIWAASLASSSLFTGWLRQAVLRHSGQDDLSISRLPRWVVPLAIFLAAVPACLITWLQTPSEDTGQMALLAIVSFAFAATNAQYVVKQASTQRDMLATRYTWAEVTRASATVLISACLAVLTPLPGSTAILVAYIVGTLAATTILSAGHTSESVESSASSATLRIFWSFGWPMAIWLTASSLLLYIDRIIITAILGSDAAGNYAATVDLIVRGFAMVSFPLTMASHPIMMRAWNEGHHEKAMAINRTYVRYLLLIGLVALLCGSVVGNAAVVLVLGMTPTNIWVVPLLTLGAVLWQVALMTHKALEVLNRTKTMAAIIVAITCVSTLGNIVLIPVLGILSPALLFALGALTYLLLTYFLGQRALTRATLVTGKTR